MKIGKGSMFVPKSMVIVLTVCLTFIAAGKSFCGQKPCTNLVGDWDYSSNWAVYNPSTGYSFTTQTGIIHVTNQNDCIFYGTIDIVSPDPASGLPLTGAIYDLKSTSVLITAGDSTLHGVLGSKKRGLYRVISYSTSNIGADQNIQFTSRGTAIRRDW